MDNRMRGITNGKEVFFVMFGKMISACLHGIEGRLIEVEVDISSGLPHIALVGLPDSAVRESAERVRAALRNSGFKIPLERITVNLAPADLRKEGSAFDLAIAAGILATSGQLPESLLNSSLPLGELALDGSVRPVPGVLSMVHRARTSGLTKIVLPREKVEEALIFEGIEIYGIGHLSQLQARAKGCLFLTKALSKRDGLVRSLTDAAGEGAGEDYADVAGQQTAKRAR